MMPKLPEPDSAKEVRNLNQVYRIEYYFPSTVRAIQEEAYKAGMAAAKQIPPDAGLDDWNHAVAVVRSLVMKHEQRIPLHWLDAMRTILEVK